MVGDRQRRTRPIRDRRSGLESVAAGCGSGSVALAPSSPNSACHSIVILLPHKFFFPNSETLTHPQFFFFFKKVQQQTFFFAVSGFFKIQTINWLKTIVAWKKNQQQEKENNKSTLLFLLTKCLHLHQPSSQWVLKTSKISPSLVLVAGAAAASASSTGFFSESDYSEMQTEQQPLSKC